MNAEETMTAGEISVKVWDMAQAAMASDSPYTVRTHTLEWAMDEIEKIRDARGKYGFQLSEKLYHAERQAGRKEVFDFLHENSAGIMMNEHALEAKLKEWGLE